MSLIMYKNYIFNLYDTLIKIKTNEEDEYLWEKMALYYSYYGANYEAYEIHKKYNKAITKIKNINTKNEYPEVDIEDVFYKLFKDKGIKPKNKISKQAAKMFRALSTESIELNDGVKELFEALKKEDKNIYILENGQSIYSISELKMYGLKKIVDDTFFSSEYGIRKQNMSLINTVLEETNMKKKNTLWISSDTIDLTNAETLNIDAVFVKTKDMNTPNNIKRKYDIELSEFSTILDF